MKGNHDKGKAFRDGVDKFAMVGDLLDLTIGKQRMVVCHYAMRVWNGSHWNAWQLYGHSHGTLPPVGKQHDLGVDVNGFRPFSFEELETIMKSRLDNPNFISGEKRGRE